MQNINLYNFMVFFIPGISSVFMLTLLGWDILTTDKHSRKPKVWLFCCIFVWMFTIFIPLLYLVFPNICVYVNWLYYLTLLLYPVFFYRFIFEITHTSDNSHFSWGHYIFPAFIALLMIVLMITTPYNEQLQALMGKYRHLNEHSLFGVISNSKPLVKLFYEIFYLVACFICLRRYNKFISNYSSNESKSSLRWIYRYLWVLLIPICLSLVMLVLPYETIITSPFALSPILLIPFLQIFLVYHTLKSDYIIAEPENMSTRPISLYDQPDLLKKSLLTKPFFEEYINRHQPYLNPDLKITDLIDDLHVNRTYISGFINSEYNLNFSQYINQCRLNEYYRLCSDPAYSSKSAEELCMLAGFSNFRYFQRLEKEQSRNSQ